MTNAISFAVVVLLAGLGLTGLLTLLRAGFPSDLIRKELKAVNCEALPEEGELEENS